MIPLYAFNDILHRTFCEPLRLNTAQYIPSHSTKIENISWDIGGWNDYAVGPCYFLFEEPLNQKDLQDLEHEVLWGQFILNKSPKNYFSVYTQILANSEISSLKKAWCKQNHVLDWYFFFHGFACLFWYHHYKFYPEIEHSNFSHVFITYNHLVDDNRSYRLAFLASLISKGLDQYGLISAPLLAESDQWKKEIFSPDTLLSTNSKLLIYNVFSKNKKKFILDIKQPTGQLSAKINIDLNKKAFWHLVTETVFYGDSLHLTEKIFKPIVSKQPFILVSTPGNLAYLKRYGFKTFDRWIDEGYDQELDNDKRIDMITDQVQKLCQMSRSDLLTMQNEMQEILEYNYHHFYFGDFKKIIVDELVDNFFNCIHTYNHDLSSRFRIPIETLDKNQIIEKLMR